MLVKNHMVVSTAGWMAYEAMVLNDPVLSTPISYLIAILAAAIPDIDTQHSWIGHRLPVISHTIRLLFGHRGFTHSFLALGLAIYGLIDYQDQFWVAPLAIGLISHLFADFMTSGGVPLLWPHDQRFRLPAISFRTGGVIEHLLSTGVVAGMCWFCLYGI